MPDHTITHVQFSSTRRHHLTALKRVVNSSIVLGNNINKKMICLEQREHCFRLNSRVFANDDVKLGPFSIFVTILMS